MKKLLILLVCIVVLSGCCWLCEQEQVIKRGLETYQGGNE